MTKSLWGLELPLKLSAEAGTVRTKIICHVAFAANKPIFPVTVGEFRYSYSLTGTGMNELVIGEVDTDMIDSVLFAVGEKKPGRPAAFFCLEFPEVLKNGIGR